MTFIRNVFEQFFWVKKNCVKDNFSKGLRITSRQKCWNAAKKNFRNNLEGNRGYIAELRPTGFENDLNFFRGNIFDLRLRQASRMSLNNFQAMMLKYGYLKFWESPRRISQQKWISGAKRKIRRDFPKNQSKNVELRLRQVLGTSYKNSGAKMLKCSRNFW